MSVTTINPATEDVLRQFEFQSANRVEEMVVDAVEAFGHWKRVGLETRLECVRVFAEGMQAGRVQLAELMTAEMGKPIKEALAEVDKCVASCHALRENFPKWKALREYDLSNGYSVRVEPLGPIVGVMPWNFPAWQVVRFAIPALLCGNSVLLKHAPNTWGSAEFLADFFRQAFPDALYANLQVDVPVIGPLIADSRIRGVSLTGSRRAGMSVAEQAGKYLKKCVLELGGSDAYVVLDDADVELAADVCTKSRLLNTGQSCVSAKRFIVTKKNRGEFAKLMAEKMKAAKDVGPLARKDLRDTLNTQVVNSLKSGAKALTGAEMPDGKGFFYPPSVLESVKPGMAAFDDELFGPVAAVIEASNEAEAFALANKSIYGLGSAIFSKDVERARELARLEMDAGMVAINDFVRSDALAPFGGVKDSGLGRELGREGSFEFTNVKTISRKV